MSHAAGNAFAPPHGAGWSLAELCFHTADGPRRHVTGTRYGVTIRGTGATQAEAWRTRLAASRHAKDVNDYC